MGTGGEDTWIDGAAPHTSLVDAVSGRAVAEASSNGLDLGAALAFARTVGGPSLRALTFAQRGALLKSLQLALRPMATTPSPM